jgi:hypothetical protein
MFLYFVLLARLIIGMNAEDTSGKVFKPERI